ncbi:YceI family protein [Defluviimonas aestuarii]|uniref:YceI family protein n=1 Tax=Albidovulum aestuarii TaxID=1130726 RepID=UPI00249B3109|nr:YceI family protein [Defluviimonas aestuarii]MDI3335313.1 YceI family protein [Defluviimonas aestuarii]
MRHARNRTALLFLFALLAALRLCSIATGHSLIPAAHAAALTYVLDREGSAVGFETDFGQTPIRGRMPVTSADLSLDFDRAAASHVEVTLNADAARASFPFATQAMKGGSVLDTGRYPEIHFESTRVRPTDTGAAVTGLLTIRGVTREITLDARLYRPEGTEVGHRENLSILLTGKVSRSDFGATGFADMVGDEVRLKILARIRRAG